MLQPAAKPPRYEQARKRQRFETLFDKYDMRAISWNVIKTHYPMFSPVDYDIVPRQSGEASVNPSIRIGEGAFGEVYKTLAASGKVVAIKVAPFRHSTKNELLEEMDILTSIHRNGDPDLLLTHVIRYLDAFTSTYNRGSPELFLVMEYIPGKDFETYFYEFSRAATDEMRMNQAYQFAYPLFRALAFLHSHGVVHRDIHLGNILIRNADNTPLFIDFGLACGSDVCDDRPREVSLGMLNEEIRVQLANGSLVDKEAWARNDCTQLAMTILGAATQTRNLREMVHDHTTIEEADRVINGSSYVLRDTNRESRTARILLELAEKETRFFPNGMKSLEGLFINAIKGRLAAIEVANGMRSAMDNLHGVNSPMNFLSHPSGLVLHV